MWSFGELEQSSSTEWLKMMESCADETSPCLSTLRKTLASASSVDECAIDTVFDDDLVMMEEEVKPQIPDEPPAATKKASGKNDRGKYKCGRCGQVKVNHVCPFGVATTRTVHQQTDDPTNAPVLPGDKVSWIKVRPRPPPSHLEDDSQPTLDGLEPVLDGEDVEEDDMALDLMEAMASPPQLPAKSMQSTSSTNGGLYSVQLPHISQDSEPPPPPPPPETTSPPHPPPEKRVRPGGAAKLLHRRSSSTGSTACALRAPLLRSNSATSTCSTVAAPVAATTKPQTPPQSQPAVAAPVEVRHRPQPPLAQHALVHHHRSPLINPHLAAAAYQHHLQHHRLGLGTAHPALVVETRQAALAQLCAADDLQRHQLGMLSPFASAPNLCALGVTHLSLPPTVGLPQQLPLPRLVAPIQPLLPTPAPVLDKPHHQQHTVERRLDESAVGVRAPPPPPPPSQPPSQQQQQQPQQRQGFNLNELMTHLNTMTPQQLQEIASMSQLVLERQTTSAQAQAVAQGLGGSAAK